MITESANKINRFAEAILKLKEGVADKLTGLPENPNITILDDRCFTMKFSDLRGKLSPEFYRFSCQYDALAKMVRRSLPENVESNIAEALKNKRVKLTGDSSHWIYLHPDVIKRVRALMNCSECGASLNVKGAIQRAYLGKHSAPTKHGLGHYNESGDYEPDRLVDLSEGSYDTLDGCDTCTECGNVVG